MIAPENTQLIDPDCLHIAATQNLFHSVLLAEDDTALRRYLEVVLQRAGYRVLAAADGLEAMKLLLTEQVDVIVTDALMPNLNGYELCRFVRNSQKFTELPIVLLSALDPKNANSETEHANVFLAKPISPDALVACLAELAQDAN
jgi:CheY-like chemotaxis protein